MSVFKSASIPAFLRDWIIQKKAGSNGKITNVDELRKYISEIIPQREQALEIKSEAISDGRSRKFLAKINIQEDVANSGYNLKIFVHTQLI